MASPEQKAWNYLRTVINNDDAFFTLKTKNAPIQVQGSQGGQYFIYPNGFLARIDKDKPFVGQVRAFAQMPLPDQIAAIYIWITQKEDKVKELWGCGQLGMYYDGKRLATENGLNLPTIMDMASTGNNTDLGTYTVGDPVAYSGDLIGVYLGGNRMLLHGNVVMNCQGGEESRQKSDSSQKRATR